jgi:hypothetical protein
LYLNAYKNPIQPFSNPLGSIIAEPEPVVRNIFCNRSRLSATFFVTEAAIFVLALALGRKIYYKM